MGEEKKIRHWFIQKPIANNVPLFENGAQFCEFIPTVSQRNCEWIRVFSADDINECMHTLFQRPGESRWFHEDAPPNSKHWAIVIDSEGYPVTKTVRVG